VKGFFGFSKQVWLAWLAACFAAAGSAFAATWSYAGGPLPTPPEQQKPWPLADTKLPDNLRALAGAAKGMFAAGWADPRGGEYREIVIPMAHFEDEMSGKDDGRLPARGWVLPGAENEPRYAVGWDGLVYPVIAMGKPADLAADARRALEEQPSLGKAAMLLRLGLTDQAEALVKRWSETAARTSWGGKPPGMFATLAEAWLRAQWDRAVWAHARGDIALALARLEPLAAARKAVEEQAERRDVRLAKRNPKTGIMGEGLDLSFLKQAPALLADERRRAAEKIGARPEIEQPDAVADKAERIRLLIRDLEEVRAERFMTPGYLSFPNEQVVKDLVAQGEDAVGPLLEVLEKDTRLTRSIDGWVGGDRRVVGVEEPALAALKGILRVRDQFPYLDVPYVDMDLGTVDSKLKPREMAKFIRAYWDKYRGQPLVRRWAGLLADDQAGPPAWAEAAEDLTLKESQPVQVYEEMSFALPPKPGQPDPMRGEKLGEETKPSITELMAKRLRESYAAGKKSKEPFAMGPSERLAKALTVWDGKNQIETLRWYSGELAKDFAAQKNRIPGDDDTLKELIRTFGRRRDAGDPRAMADYAQWLRGANAAVLAQVDRPFYFAPLWQSPDDPAIAEVTKWAFTDPASPWVKGGEGMNPVWISRTGDSPLVALPDFRALLLKHMDDPLVVGRAELTPGGRVAYLRPFATNQEGGGAESMTENAQDVTLGDKIAGRLALVRGVPEFSESWPADQRAAAKAKIAEFVRRYGDRWTPRQEGPWDDRFMPTKAGLDFPALDHPATPDDVTQGRAIFSTEGASNRAVWPLPETGARRARWITLEDYPGAKGPDGKVTYDQEVEVWQAEDSVVDREARRTFGVVAKHHLAAVPGEELDFSGLSDPPSDGWQVDALLDEEPLALKPGGPVPVKLRATNQRGIPRQFVGPDHGPTVIEAEKLALEVRVKYYPGPLSLLRKAGLSAVWADREPRGPVKVEMIASPRLVDTLGSVEFLRFDAGKYFDLSAPGVYHVELTFREGGMFNAKRTVWGPQFELKE